MKKKKRKVKKIFKLLFVLIILLGLGVGAYFLFGSKNSIINKINSYNAYVSSADISVPIYDLEYNEVDKLFRGTSIKVYEKEYINEEVTYIEIKYDNKSYLINKEDITKDKNNVIKETELYVRTSTTIYKEGSGPIILSYVKKGEKVDIVGFNDIKDGVVDRYKIKYNDSEGYVYSKYLVGTKEEADLLYNENGVQEYMEKMGDYLGGGTATHLDFYPYEKPKFEDNEMPEEARTIYINSAAVKDIDEYIDFALNNNINAFVIDIKDNTSPAYNSPKMEEYSKTNFDHALNEYADYKEYVKKAKDAGIYVIGRITTFKDSYFVEDHPEVAIINSSGGPFSHNGSYWPSAYNRYVWQFTVELAIEAVKEIGFNEIQFDYVRFPDRTTTLENNGVISLNNTYEEEKAQALQAFVMYACDNIHEVGAYVSIDVFGESASDYVTAYGQFWPAISNVADAISGMPYPDHFNAHEYGISEVVWTVPYKLLNAWGASVSKKQEVIPTPAVVRTWIQTYNATREPYTVYDSYKISEQIQALYDNGLTGGYMTWNSGSNIYKYREVSEAFKKEYR